MIDDLRQRHVETFFRLMRESGVEAGQVSAPEYTGLVVRSAQTAGIIEEGEDVGDMFPADVVRMASEVNKAISDALTVKKKVS